LVTFIACEIVTGGGLTEILGTHPGRFQPRRASPAWRRRLSPGHAAPRQLREILLSGHGRLSDTPQDGVRIAIRRSHGLLSDTAQPFDALDARSNFEPIMLSVRDPNKLDDA
jgi:hypothetical protein